MGTFSPSQTKVLSGDTHPGKTRLGLERLECERMWLHDSRRSAMRLGSKLLGEGRVGIYASRRTKAYPIDSRLGALIVRILEGK